MKISFRYLIVVLGLAAGVSLAVRAVRQDGQRAVLAAVDARDFCALSGRRPEAMQDLWERIKAMGVSAVVLREDSLADLAERGEILDFSRAEVEKWRTAGLIAASAGLRGGTIWAKDSKALSRTAEALAARGIDVSTVVVGGARALELPVGVDLGSVPAGFDPPLIAALSSAGLVPVAASTQAVVSVAGHLLWTRTLGVDASTGEILRAAFSRPLRLIVFRSRGQGLEANLELLRLKLRTLRDAGFPAVLPAVPSPSEENRTGNLVRLIFVWLLGVAGPLLAVRAALKSARWARARVSAILPIASPVPQVLTGLAAAWALAGLAGLIVAGAAPAGWRDGSAHAWSVWTWCSPFFAGAVALLTAAKPAKRGGWSAPIRRRDLAAAAIFALAAAMLLAPRAAVRISGFWESFDRLSASGAFWWWPWHWRAALVGTPCLALALSLIEGRDVAPGPHEPASLWSDPRGWLLVGLLGPASLIVSTGGSGAPLGETMIHGAEAWILGLLIVAVLSGFRSLR